MVRSNSAMSSRLQRETNVRKSSSLGKSADEAGASPDRRPAFGLDEMDEPVVVAVEVHRDARHGRSVRRPGDGAPAASCGRFSSHKRLWKEKGTVDPYLIQPPRLFSCTLREQAKVARPPRLFGHHAR